MDHVDLNLNCILVMLPSKFSPTGILMQREDIILEWIFLPHKTHVEKVAEVILKGKLRHDQLARIDPTLIVVLFASVEINNLWEDNEP